MIEETSFGSVTIDGVIYDHDVVILPDEIIRRKKEITKNKHGTSHKFTKEEMKFYLNRVDISDINLVIVGTGQYGKLGLKPETKKLLEENDIEYEQVKTPELIKQYKNSDSRKNSITIIHVTC